MAGLGIEAGTSGLRVGLTTNCTGQRGYLLCKKSRVWAPIFLPVTFEGLYGSTARAMSINTIGSTKGPVSFWNKSYYKQEKLSHPGPCGMVAELADYSHGM